MSCSRCEELMVPFSIRTPAALGKAVRVVQANLADGTLSQIDAGRGATRKPFLSIPEDGPWEDLLKYRFECSECGQEFDLSAETFHGGGGEWTPHNLALNPTGLRPAG